MNTFFWLIALLLAAPAWATVSLHNANYSSTWTDIQVRGGGLGLQVMRTYNSRSNYNGMFGYGWCSNFETRLEKTPQGGIKLITCGAGDEVLYEPPPIGRDIFFAHSVKPFEYIEFKDGQYESTERGGRQSWFDASGRLTRLADQNGHYLRLDYDQYGHLKRVSNEKGQALEFQMGGNGKVAAITASDKSTVVYQYHNQDDLVSVKNAWGNTYAYAYDDAHNLVRLDYPDKTFSMLTYDTKRDWVTSFTGRNGCLETYAYQDIPDDPKHHYSSKLIQTCGGEVYKDVNYEFWEGVSPAGNEYLARYSEREDEKPPREVSYHEIWQLPVLIRRGEDEYRYEYFKNGLVKSRSSRFSRISFEYETDFGEPMQITSQTLNDNGDVIKNMTTILYYDEHANVKMAANSEGKVVMVDYDSIGRISKLLELPKDVVTVQYDKKCGCPSVMKKPGLGITHVSYDAACEISKVWSPQGASVAAEVAASFNRLLEVLAPSTADIYE